jgi:SP family xylose:H+ symportor-like MFS transporter
MQDHNHYIRRLAIVASIGGLLFGYDTAVISGTVSSLEQYFIIPMNMDVNASNAWLGFVVSSALIGCIIGGAIAGLLSAKIGRRMALIVASLLLLISAVGSAWPEFPFAWPGTLGADGIYLFVFYRIIGGIGVGMASMLSPMYIAEIAPAEHRGRLVSWNQFAIIFGMLLVYFVNWGIARSGDTSWLDTIGWRWMFASEVLPATIFMSLLFTVPESPRYLMLTKRYDEARTVLQRLNPAQTVSRVYDEILDSVSTSERAPMLAFGLKIVLIGMLVSAFQQFVGINVVLYYAPEIFKNMGASTDSALLQTIIVGAVNLIFTVVAINTVDKWGRRPLQILGAIVMAFSMISLAILFQIQSLGIVALIAMLVYIAGFAMSWGPVTWVILSEIFPNSIRSKAMALAVATQWIANYIVSFTFPILDNHPLLVEHFNHGFAYWIYGSMSILAAFFIWKWVPETKEKSLESLEDLWKKH